MAGRREWGDRVATEERGWSRSKAGSGVVERDEPLVTVARPWYEDDAPARGWERAEAAFRGSAEDEDAGGVAESAFAATLTPQPATRSRPQLPPLLASLAQRWILLAGLVVLAGALLLVGGNVAAGQESARKPALSIPPGGSRALLPAGAEPISMSRAQTEQASVAVAEQPAAPPEATAVPQPGAPHVTYCVAAKPVIVRNEPSVGGAPLFEWAERTLVEATGVWARGADGLTWWEMRDMSGRTGWAPGMDFKSVP